MSENQEYLTKEKYTELEKELHELKTIKRKEIAEALEYAKSLGDLSENAEYHQARDDQANLEYRINYLDNMLKSAVIMKARRGDTVGVGSKAVIKKKKGDKKEIQIVGSEEVDMSLGKISNTSPLGRAILGKKAGEKFSFDTPSGVMEYEVVSIN
ncbi:transcription elongation factor GreA [Patescibacteria group bacterium]